MLAKDSQYSTRDTSACVRPKRRNLLMAPYRLRIDDGIAVEEYRIENGSVEHRIFSGSRCSSLHSPWRRLSPDQLASHVTASTVVAHWLVRRMGIQKLIRACNQHCMTDAAPRSCGAETVTAEFSPLVANRT